MAINTPNQSANTPSESNFQSELGVLRDTLDQDKRLEQIENTINLATAGMITEIMKEGTPFNFEVGEYTITGQHPTDGRKMHYEIIFKKGDDSLSFWFETPDHCIMYLNQEKIASYTNGGPSQNLELMEKKLSEMLAIFRQRHQAVENF